MQANCRCAALTVVLPSSFVAGSARALAASPCAGHWVGAIELPTGKLAVDVDLTRQGDGWCAGDISIPQQGAKDVALMNVVARTALEGFDAWIDSARAE